MGWLAGWLAGAGCTIDGRTHDQSPLALGQPGRAGVMTRWAVVNHGGGLAPGGRRVVRALS